MQVFTRFIPKQGVHSAAAGFYINKAKFCGDRLVPENFIHIMMCLY